MRYVRRNLRLPAKLDQAITEYQNNDNWSANARALLEVGLTAIRADGVIRYDQLTYGERIAILTQNERLAYLLAQKLQLSEPLQLPTGEYLVMMEV